MSTAAKQIAQRALISERASARAFAPTTLTDDLVASVLRLTQRAPSAFNTQPYVAVIARKEEDRARIAEAMLDSNKVKVTGAPLVVVFAADLEPSKQVPRLQQMMRDNGVPEVVQNILPGYLKGFSGEGTEKGSIAWAYKQTAIAATTFIYAASAHGLVTRPMEGYDQEALKKAVGLTDRHSVAMVISAGYADESQPLAPGARLEPTEVFHEGTLGGSTEALFKTE